MQLEPKEQESLRQYLLGSLPAGQILALEERLLTDSAFYEELLIVEDELIDQYLSGEQSPTERQGFETHFSLAPERQQKIRFARALRKYLSDNEKAAATETITAASPLNEPTYVAAPGPRRPSFFPFLHGKPILAYSLTATLVLIIGVVSWIALNRSKNPASHAHGQVLAVVLTPGLSRSVEGDEIKKISIPPGTDILQLQLELPKAGYSSYRAEIFTSERTSVSVIEGLHPEVTASKEFITMPVSVDLLKRDDYQVQLRGQRSDGSYEDVAGYVFRVLNQPVAAIGSTNGSL